VLGLEYTLDDVKAESPCIVDEAAMEDKDAMLG
jgi:hypothetical protein